MLGDHGLKPEPFQFEGEKFLATRRGGGLLDEMGLGKTMQSILANRHFEGPTLIVSRPLNKPFWAEEIRRWDPEPGPIRFAVEGGHYDFDEVQRWFKFPRKRGFLIIHHEALWRVVTSLRKHGIWETVIADEGHRFKNRNAQQTTALKWIPAYHRYALSGSITEKDAADMWSLLNWFDPKVFTSYHDFARQFVDSEVHYMGGRKILGSKNYERLGEIIAPYFLRRTREQVGLPGAVEPTSVPIDMSASQKQLYKDLEEETFIDLQNEEAETLFIPNALARLNRLKFAALDPALFGSAIRGTKIDWLLEWQAEHNEPYVVFTESRVFADHLPMLLPDGATISGSVSQKKRDKALSDFDAGRLRYLVGTIGAMSESVNLDRAHLAVFTDLVWSSIAMPQAEMRIQRLTSKEPARIYRLLARGSVDYLYLDALQHKYTDRELIYAFLDRFREQASGNGINVPLKT